MITDTIKNYKRYSALNSRFKEAFEFIVDKADSLADGKYELDGKNLFVMLTTADLKNEEDAKLEAHNSYIDIQLILDGYESMGYRTRESCSDILSQYDSEKDIIFYNEKSSLNIPLSAGGFAIFYPEDCHAPLIGEGKVRKAIVKVKIG